ncbi:MAG: arsenate reductase/protein-tyrosine-phosphatase family protein [Minisyncoccota bacterium]
MTTQKSILFVCTGNIFRSLAAEQAFKKYLSDNNRDEWEVSSAGIAAAPEPVDPKTLETLRELGVDASDHRQKKLTQDMLHEYDVVVGMAENHIEFMKSEFNYKYSMLFNELVSGEKTSVTDIDEIPDYQTNRQAVEEKIERTVKGIFEDIPSLFKNVSERFYLFSDFVEKKITHRNGFPFITLHETPHSIAFMSLDIPFNEDGHVLVIPKKRYPSLSLIPDEILADVLISIKRVGHAISAYHGGYNVLLNNGLDAGQYIIHTHFHIIPRRSGDGITIEGWEHPKITLEEFIRLNEQLKQQIEQTLPV